MSSISGPGGSGGPGGIGGPEGPGGPDGPDELDGADAPEVAGATGTGHADLDALSAEVAAGRLTPREAIDRLVEATASAEMDETERAELRELLSDLVANDPYLGGLANRL
jgi:hypothetical protein